MAAKRKHDEDAVNLSSTLLANVDNIMDSSKELVQLSDWNSKENSNDLDDNMSSPLIQNEETREMSDIKEKEKEEITEFILSLPREMLSAYIILCLKKEQDWKLYGCCGQFGVFLAYAIPFSIQIIVTLALMSEIKPRNIQFDTTKKEQFIFNLCALSILFIYVFDKSIALLKSTWYYLNKLQRDQQNKNDPSASKYASLSDLRSLAPIDLPQMEDIVSGAVVSQVKHKCDELLATDLSTMSHTIDESGKTWAVFCVFKLQIICVFVIHFTLMLYALIAINTTKHLVGKLEVAISIFFILELDDWAYQLFIAQNLILSDSDFEIKIPIKIKNHSEQLSKNKWSLWCSLITIVLSVGLVILASVIFNPQ